MATETPTSTRGFLFADLRDYTAYVESHGDIAAVELLRTYRALVRACVAASDGAEIRTEGDSFYVVFPSASGAVMCGLDIVEAAIKERVRPDGAALRVGVGIHAGETAETSEGYVGSAVNIAARVCAQAAADQVLVTETVRFLTRTRLPVRFVSRGQRKLKGIDEPVGLYAVERAATRPSGGSSGTTGRRLPEGRMSRTILLAGGLLIVILGATAAALGLRGGTAAVPPPSPGATAARSIPGATLNPGTTTSASTIAASPNASGLRPSTAPSPESSDPTQLGFPTTDERTLLERIPKDVRATCRRAVDADGTLGTFSLVCDLPFTAAADRVWWDRFSTKAELELAFQHIVTEQQIKPGDCETERAAVQPWDEFYQGRLACYSTGGAARIAWTYPGPEDLILGRAERVIGNSAALYQWWKSVGPFLYR